MPCAHDHHCSLAALLPDQARCRLEETIRGLTAQLKVLGERQILPGDLFLEPTGGRLAGTANEALRNKVTDLARELGRKAPLFGRIVFRWRG